MGLMPEGAGNPFTKLDKLSLINPSPRACRRRSAQPSVRGADT
jgi:hypothetical protein